MAPDFTLISCDGLSSVRVHRLLLAARSPVFKTLLSMDSQEARSGSMHLKDTSIEVLRVLSDFLYSDQVRLPHGISIREAIDLCLFADEYDFKALTTASTAHIACNINSSADANLVMQLTTKIESDVIRNAATRFLQAA
jgi:hypothetical protein